MTDRVVFHRKRKRKLIARSMSDNVDVERSWELPCREKKTLKGDHGNSNGKKGGRDRNAHSCKAVSMLAKQTLLCKKTIRKTRVPLRKAINENLAYIKKQPKSLLSTKLDDIALFIEKVRSIGIEHQTALNTAHIVSEFFTFLPRSEVYRLVVDSFSGRFKKRLKLDVALQSDKIKNPLTALPATPGLGKSTTIAHLAFSNEYREYHACRQQCTAESLRVSVESPLVACLSFNSAMGYLENEGNTLGLRIVYGAVCHISPKPPLWVDFSRQFAHLKTLSGIEAVSLLRQVFGADRLILLCIDELSKAGKDYSNAKDSTVQEIMRELGRILDMDGRTDVVVSALSPMYVHSLVTGSNREVNLVSVSLLSHGELHEQFKLAAKEELEKIATLVEDRFQRNVLNSLDLLTSGHPRMMEQLAIFINDGFMHTIVTSIVGEETNALGLLRKIAESDLMAPLKTLANYPETNEEREIVLSVLPRDAVHNFLFRNMLESSRCFIHEHKLTGSATSMIFRATTTLSVFFGMLRTIDKVPDDELGPLSLAAKKLFSAVKQSFVTKKKTHERITISPQISGLWECSRGLSIVSQVNCLINQLSGDGVVNAHNVFGLSGRAKFGFQLWLSRDLQVKRAHSVSDMKWQDNTLYLAPADNPGFDLVLCMSSKGGQQMFMYEETKVALSAEQQTIELVTASKLLLTVRYHLQLCNVSSATEEKQLSALQCVAFVLSVYDHEGTVDQAAVMQHLEEARSDAGMIKLRTFVKITQKFVMKLWDHVAFLGTKEMDACMLPVVLPIARLVQAVYDK